MEESFEDILKESKQLEKANSYEKTDKKLRIGAIITGILLALSYTSFLPEDSFSFLEGFFYLLIGVFISYPIIFAIISLPISLIPIKDWDYKKRFRRVFLITAIVLYGLFSLVIFIGSFFWFE